MKTAADRKARKEQKKADVKAAKKAFRESRPSLPSNVVKFPTPNQPGQAEVPNTVENIKNNGKYGCIITNTEPEALLYCTPVLRTIFVATGVKADIVVTKPQNESFFKLIDKLQYINSIQVCEKIDDEVAAELQKQFGVLTMLNIGAAMQHAMQRGLSPAMALGAVINVVVPPGDALLFDASISEEAHKLAQSVLESKGITKKFVCIANTFAAALPPEYTEPRSWSSKYWMELIDLLHDQGLHVVVISNTANKHKALFPTDDVVIDGIVSLTIDDAELAAAVIAKSEVVVTIDCGYAPIANACRRKIVQIASGAPVTWGGTMYPADEEYNNKFVILASIMVDAIEPKLVAKQVMTKLGE